MVEAEVEAVEEAEEVVEEEAVVGKTPMTKASEQS